MKILGCRSSLGEDLPRWLWKCGTFYSNIHVKVYSFLIYIQSQLESLSKRLFCGPQAPYPAWLFAKHLSCVRTHIHLPILTCGEYKSWFDSFWLDISFNSTVKMLVRAAQLALDAMQSKSQSKSHNSQVQKYRDSWKLVMNVIQDDDNNPRV